MRVKSFHILVRGHDENRRIFEGHCWSNQTHFPAITRAVSANESLVAGKEPSALHFPTLHPSYKPKCSHAYALTRSGARRLWLLLRHPPFAYSRAVDQAFAWLVESGRVTSFSIVPPLVVQRKVSASDVLDGLGSGWREGLENGVFGSGA